MPNEFIARNGVISRGNLIVSGSITSTSPASFSGSLSLTGDLNFQPGTTGASRFISMSALPTTGNGNNIVIQAGDATTAGTGGSVSIQPGAGAGGPGAGTVVIGNTTWWNGATVNGILTVTNGGPNTGTALTVNAGGQLAMRYDWDNINLVTSAVSSANRILRFTGASQYQVRGSGTTSSTTALLVQNANASASFIVRDDSSVQIGNSSTAGSLIIGDAYAKRLYFYPDFGTTNSRIQGGYGGYISFGGIGGGNVTTVSDNVVSVGSTEVYFNYTTYSGAGIENRLSAGNFRITSGSSTTYFFVSGSGNVGIGTTSPSASLHISGSSSSTLLEIDSPAVNNILYVSGSGRVGIATSTPSATFTVGNTDTVFGSNVGYGAIYGTGSDGIVQIQTNGSSTEMLFRPNNSPGSYNSNYWSKIVQANYSMGIYPGGYQSLILATGNAGGNGAIMTFTGGTGTGVDAITINGPTNSGRVAITTYGSSPITLNGGNVLVGTTTGSAKLTVKGSGTTSSSTGLLVQNANASASFTITDNLNATFGGVISGPGSYTLGTTSSNTPLLSISGYFLGNGAITTANSNGRSFNTIIGGQNSGIVSTYNGVAQGATNNNEYFLAGGNINLTDGAIDLRGFSFAPTIVSETGSAIKAFWSGLSAASNRYNLFLSGSAQNYIAGNVGIGILSPSASLHISGSLYVDGFANYLGTISSSIVPANNPSASLMLIGGITTQNSTLSGSSVVLVNTVMSASANNQTLVGLDLNPSFNTGVFTGTLTAGLRTPSALFTNTSGDYTLISKLAGASGRLTIYRPNSTTNAVSFGGGNAEIQVGQNNHEIKANGATFEVNGINNLQLGSSGTGFILFKNATTESGKIFNTGNFVLQNGGTFTDAGYRLDVSGSARLNGTGLTTGQHTVATLGFTGGSSTITSIGNAYINFYTRGFRGFDLYNGSSAADTQKVLIGNFAAYGVEGARYSAAMLIVESETRGFLPPRTGFTSNITSPGQGLITYITASTAEGLYYYNSGSYQAWTRVLNDSGSQNITGNLTVTGSITATGGLTASSAIINGNLTVIGTASFTYTTASVVNIGGNLINLNTNNPAARFGGLTVTDSGSFGTSSTGSLLWDSQNNRWIYSNPSGSSYDGGLLISGPRNTSGLGSEEGTTLNALMKGQGGDHITSSGVFEVSGSVGIGTSSPTQKLDVSGSAIIQNNLIIGSGNQLRLNDSTNANVATISYTSTGQQGPGVVNSWGGSGVFSWNNSVLNMLHAGTGNDVIILNRSVLSSGTTSNQALWFTGYGSFAPTTGTNTFSVINIGTEYNATGGTTTIRGLYYSPVLTSLTGVTHRAIETVTGDVLLNTTSGNTLIGSSVSNTAKLSIKGSGTTSSTTALLVQNANASSSFSIKDNGDSTFFYSGVVGYSLKISGSYSGNGTSAIYETLGASGGYYGIHEFRTGLNGQSSTRAMSIVYGGRVVIGNKSDTTLQSPQSNLFVDTNVINTFSSQSFNTGIIINPSGTLDTKFTASGIQFNFAANSPNDTNGGAFVGSQWNPLTNGYDSDLVIFSSQGNAGSYVETGRFVGKSKSLSLGAGRNPSASLHISGSSNSALLEIDSPAVNNILYVTGSGRVGIGTGIPTTALDVNGTFKVSNTSTFDSQATFNNANIVATGINSQVGNFTINRANSNTSVEILGGATSVKFDASDGSATTMFIGKTSVASSYITASAMLHVRSTGTSNSTTALLVQNANASASLSVTDDRLVTVSSKLQVGTFTPGVATGSSTIFTTGRISAGGGVTVYNPTAGDDGNTGIFFNGGLQIYSNNATVALFRSIGGGNSGFMFNVGGYGYNPSSGTGTVNTVLIDNTIVPTGTNSINYNYVTVSPGITQGSFGTGTIRGFYFAPVVSSLNTSPLRAFESTRGDVIIGGNATVTITGSLLISGSAGTGSAVLIQKSGSTVLDIQGSQGQLFSVIDTLSGSLMSVNDVSGLPILEVFSDDRVVMGTYGSPALTITGSNAIFTGSVIIDGAFLDTVRTGSLPTGSSLVYTVNTGSYTAGFFDYYVSSGSNFRAGNIMAVFGAGTYKFTDLATPDIGSTTNLQFSMSMAGASAQLFASASSAGWTVKTTFRTI